MITTVTLNPAIDRTILINGLEYGEVNRINRGREDIGGKGINVSKVLHQFYEKTIALGFIGEENTEDTFRLLKKDNVEHDFVLVEAMTRTNVVIVELDKDITTNINESGCTINEFQYKSFVEKMMNYANDSSYMVFSGSLPNGLTDDTYKNLIDMVRDKVRTVLDADGELLIQGIKSSPYMIKPNIHELEHAFNTTIDTDEKVIKIARKMIADYGITLVLVSLGKDGAILVSKDEAHKAEPVEVDVKNTVGAGDSMVGGFIHGLSEGYDLSTCLKYGSACGTLAVMTEANQTLDHSLLASILKEINIISY
ncbi:MAG: 1-phosphofructokinase [Vallitaleaceae bacterium]|jgi:1-phosphofructokinase|nr:1-phosphofructokinase [Vallitaleaceae bacterium]